MLFWQKNWRIFKYKWPKKNLINDKKNSEYFGNNDVIFYNQEHPNKVKIKDDDNHSRSALIRNKKECIDDINDSLTK